MAIGGCHRGCPINKYRHRDPVIWPCVITSAASAAAGGVSKCAETSQCRRISWHPQCGAHVGGGFIGISMAIWQPASSQRQRKRHLGIARASSAINVFISWQCRVGIGWPSAVGIWRKPNHVISVSLAGGFSLQAKWLWLNGVKPNGGPCSASSGSVTMALGGCRQCRLSIIGIIMWRQLMAATSAGRKLIGVWLRRGSQPNVCINNGNVSYSA